MTLLAKTVLLVAIVWIALAPPLFTGGSCTAEFDHESATLDRNKEALKSSEKAHAYWNNRSVPHRVLSVDDCRRAKPRNLDRCGSGPLLIAKVPVNDTICKIYRDDEIRVMLHYDGFDRLSRMEVDMNPYRSLPIPFTNYTIHWAR